ncbi:hypothetical protein B0T19DRAFT_164786 [Cercophora scortea]|uniref:Uncharacterized protein n=1 Tax=Cercophora scortea TaxID=314031 RepID=A0AAE0IM80_9PEZI|nr:hypothetical protein B0T19DRAFT_164786 [Cercophora scortea]
MTPPPICCLPTLLGSRRGIRQQQRKYRGICVELRTQPHGPGTNQQGRSLPSLLLLTVLAVARTPPHPDCSPVCVCVCVCFCVCVCAVRRAGVLHLASGPGSLPGSLLPAQAQRDPLTPTWHMQVTCVRSRTWLDGEQADLWHSFLMGRLYLLV